MTALPCPAEPYGLVYLITNTVNGKQYVGQTTVGLAARWDRHVKSSRAAKRDQPISAAIRRYGAGAFTMAVLRECADQGSLSAAELEAVERRGAFAPQGYNLRAGGGGKGRLAPELRARLSAAFPEAERQRLRAAYAGRRWSDLAYQRAAETNAARFHIYDPVGRLVEVVNATAFLAQLDGAPPLANFLHAARGRRLSAGGWTLLPGGAPDARISPTPTGYTCGCCGVHLLGYSDGMAKRRHAVRCASDRALLEAARALGNISAEEYASRVAAWSRAGEEIHWQRVVAPPSAVRRLSAPDGVVYDVTQPVAQFCAAHALDASLVGKLLKGRIGSHRGWTVAA